jgi:hypothetical protein
VKSVFGAPCNVEDVALVEDAPAGVVIDMEFTLCDDKNFPFFVTVKRDKHAREYQP